MKRIKTQYHTVHSKNNRSICFGSTELNYCPNHKIFMVHIRLIHTNLTTKKYLADFGRSAGFLIFSIFFFSFFFKNSVVRVIFRFSFFLIKILYNENIPKINKKIFGELYNIKELSRKKFWQCTQQARKKSIFSIFRFFDFKNTPFWGIKTMISNNKRLLYI